MATFYKGDAIAVEGLNATIRGIKKINKDAPKEVLREIKRRVERDVLPEARKEWRSQDIKPSMADTVLRPAAGQTWAGLRARYKDKRFGYAAGVVFGSWQYPQFRPWKGNQYTGNTTWDDYVVGPAVGRKGDDFADGLLDDMARAVVRGFVGDD